VSADFNRSGLSSITVDSLPASRHVLASIGIATRNALDEQGTSRVLLELEKLNLLVGTGAPKAHGVLRDGTLRVVQDQLSARVGLVAHVTAHGPVLVLFRMLGGLLVAAVALLFALVGGGGTLGGGQGGWFRHV